MRERLALADLQTAYGRTQLNSTYELRLPPPDHVRNVLITGGAGFIGSNLLHWLVPYFPKIQFTCLDSLTYAGNPMNLTGLASYSNFEFMELDITCRSGVMEIIAKIQPDYVFHLAAETHVDQSIIDPLKTANTNVLGTLNLMEACRKTWKNFEGKRFLQVSTDEVFGSIDKGKFTTESAYNPSSPYSASKAGGDHFVNAYYRTYGFPSLVTYCTNNFGPRQNPEKLMPLVILHCLKGDKLPVYGDGKNVREWLFVDDHCSGLWSAALRGEIGQAYAFGSGNEVENIELVKSICKICATKLDKHENAFAPLIEFVRDRPGHDRRYAIDSSKSRNDLGWSPKFEFHKALESTVEWYLANPAWIDSVNDPRDLKLGAQ